MNCFEQSDPFLIDALKENHIKEPSDKPYNFSVPVAEVATGGQYGQPWYLDNVIFKEQVKNGFFIEAGAWDGVYLTNTLVFELREGGVIVHFKVEIPQNKNLHRVEQGDLPQNFLPSVNR